MGILSALEQRGYHPRDPALARLLGVGLRSAAGIDVTEESALSSTAVFAAVRLIAETIASVPLKVYERQERGKRPAPEHPLWEVLHDEPNEEVTSIEAREMIQGFALTCGTGYAELVTDGAGRVAEYWPIPSYRVRPKRLASTRLVYEVRNVDGSPRTVPAEDMLVIRGFSRDGVLGWQIVEKMREAIGLGIAMERFGATFFGNNALPGGVLEHPLKLSKEANDRLREHWENLHKGSDRAHRVAVLEEGMKFHQMTVAPEAAQFLGSRKFHITEIARIFNVPPHMLRDLERATFSNIEHQAIEFVTLTIRPWAVRWEQSLRKRMLLPSEKPRIVIEHVLEGLLRGDIKSRFEAYAIARQNGVFNADDWRELENMNPIGGPAGETYWMPVNMIPADQADLLLPSGEDLPDPDSDDDDAETEGQRAARALPGMTVEERSIAGRQRLRTAYERRFRAAARKHVRGEVGAVRKAISDSFGARDAATFRAWLDRYYEQLPDALARLYAPVLATYARAVHREAAGEVGRDPVAGALDEFVRAYAAQLGVREARAAANQLRQILRDTDPADVEPALRQRADEWEEKRAEKIARREAQRAMGAFSSEAYLTLGVIGLRWRTVSDNCPLCATLNGRRIGIRDVFLTPGTTIDPGDGTPPLTTKSRIRHPPLHDGCDCLVTAVI